MSRLISDESAIELGGMAVSKGILSQPSFDKMKILNQESGQSMISIMFEKAVMDEFSLARFVAESYGLNFKEVDPESISQEAQGKLNEDYLRINNVCPFETDGSTLKVAICDQSKLTLEKNIRVITGMNIEMVLVTVSNFEQLLNKFGISASAQEVGVLGTLKKMKEVEEIDAEVEQITERDKTAAEIFVTDILTEAYKKGVSDIHIESFRKSKRLRYRIDGILINQKKRQEEINDRYLAVVSILKLLSGARIEEKRLPQDGAIAFNNGDVEFDLRVSFLPVQGLSERVVMRILRKDAIQLDLPTLGFSKKDYAKIEEAINATQGLILVTGPTGSGKTTTLYSVLNELNDEKKNIMTAEDPIEYELEGISQSQMKNEINFTFASALRTFLRQDPEIILVGEIRDQETGNIAVEAALTGHLVLSTLHTNDSVNTITRLVNMGIPNYLVSSSVSLVIAQRLARKNCDACKVKDTSVKLHTLTQLGIKRKITLYKGKGCSKCNNTGYKGRRGIYEVLKITPTIQDAILKNKTAPEIMEIAKKEGYQPMQEVGAQYLKEGVLAFEEFQRTLFVG
ncbi:MAG: pilus assembly protein PilB [Gammaproteobacteria bacterium]|nr:pilus assembly protein PilB [Gammaproteobacteria bacterium]|tara:strand:- start:295 stop:2004 length:1710 start_codon:yes stop_codon:yes gene_type:complete